MSKVYILSIQGQQLVTVNGYQERHGQYSNWSYIKVIDTTTGKKLDWKIGVFTQPEGQFLREKEIEILNNLGFNCFYIYPWDRSKNNKDAQNVVDKIINKDQFTTFEDEDGDEISAVFDGYVIIGEIEIEKAKLLSNKYSKENLVY